MNCYSRLIHWMNLMIWIKLPMKPYQASSGQRTLRELCAITYPSRPNLCHSKLNEICYPLVEEGKEEWFCVSRCFWGWVFTECVQWNSWVSPKILILLRTFLIIYFREGARSSKYPFVRIRYIRQSITWQLRPSCWIALITFSPIQCWITGGTQVRIREEAWSQ